MKSRVKQQSHSLLTRVSRQPPKRISHSKSQARSEKAASSADWRSIIPPSEWAIYQEALSVILSTKIPFVLAGGFGLAAYTRRWRNTKDIDLVVRPQDRQTMIDALTQAGFEDYYNRHPYDRGWIYRAYRNGMIVDMIWSMANRRAEVDDSWFTHVTYIQLFDQLLPVIPAEELAWMKLYVLQRDRCDWLDVINLFYAVGPQMNWDHLLKRLGPDAPLLKGVLSLFRWLTPKRAAELPQSLFEKLGRLPEFDHEGDEASRIQLLDTRPWFAAHQPEEKPLAV
jgi:hypothetical protein